MPFRLIIALALSLALHGGLFIPDILKRQTVAPPRPALQALLRPPPVPDIQTEPLLKNTLDTEEAATTPQAAPVEPPPVKPSSPITRKTVQREARLAQRKLHEHLFYPPEAIERGIEGEVRLILRLGAHGEVDDISIAASSGHVILDNAAIKAAYAMGRLTGVSSHELILPVIFRLQ